MSDDAMFDAGRLRAGFRAHGTLARPVGLDPPTPARRRQLIAEFAVVFLLAPVLMSIAVYHYRVPLFMALPPVLLGTLALIAFDKTFDIRREVSRLPTRAQLGDVLRLFIPGVLVVGLAVAVFMPERLFSLVLERPTKWLKIVSLYPFTSVLAQEFVYRVVYFHRYAPLFSSRAGLILANAVVFGVGHVLFRNWIAVGATFAAGILLAWRYDRTRSFWVVWAEHVLWGWLAFTIGLGAFFMTGPSNPGW